MSLTVGIDLGTTYSVIAYIDPSTQKPVIIKNRYGNSTTPSAIGFNSDGTYVIGEDAKTMEESGDVNTASFYKLHMGDHSYKISIYGKQYTAKDLSALFLKRLVEDAEQTIGQKISDAVITVPAYFEEASKNDTIQAGQQAGLNIINIISEPTAACVAYGLNEDGLDRKILIYDLGGGTFDVTIAQVNMNSIEVLGTNGHHQLGGRDWDSALCDWMSAKFYEETGIDISSDEEIAATNMVKAEKAKKQLSITSFTDIIVDNGEQKCKFRLTRDEFESLTAYQLGITTDLIDETFEEIGINWADLDGAVLVGGSTKMPMVRNYIQENNVPILEGVHPDEAVAIGAAIQANISHYCALLPGDRKKSSFSLGSAKKMNLSQLPGAKVIKDVISHSLGMIMSNEDETRFVNDIMIRRNTSIENAHTTKRRELRVSKNKDKNLLDIYLLQGESDEPIDCTIAKRYCFFGIDYVPGGKTILEITFSHTINGTIDISAVQTETGKILKFREETIPDDMSWITRSPRDLYSETVSSSPQPGVLVMALDVSGSMDGERITEAKKAMINFVSEFEETDIEIGIVAFADSSEVICKPTHDYKKVKKAISSLVCNIHGIGYGTSANPLPLIHKTLHSYRKYDFVYTIILTDGYWGAQQQALKSKQDFIKSEYEIIGMGFGEADINFLRKLSTREELAKVDDIMSLNENLSSIARIISN